MNPIETGRRAEAARDSYLNDLFERCRAQLMKEFLTCTKPDEELWRFWEIKEAIDYIEAKVKIDIQRGIAAQKELNL